MASIAAIMKYNAILLNWIIFWKSMLFNHQQWICKHDFSLLICNKNQNSKAIKKDIYYWCFPKWIMSSIQWTSRRKDKMNGGRFQKGSMKYI